MILAEHFLQNGPLHFQANNIPARYKIFITNFRPTYEAYKDKAYNGKNKT